MTPRPAPETDEFNIYADPAPKRIPVWALVAVALILWRK